MTKKCPKNFLKSKLSLNYIRPFKKFCNNCHKEVTTFVNKETHPVCYVWSILLLYFYGVWAWPAIIILAPLLRTLTHLCPYCQNLLVKKGFYPIKEKDNVNYFMVNFIFSL